MLHVTPSLFFLLFFFLNKKTKSVRTKNRSQPQSRIRTVTFDGGRDLYSSEEDPAKFEHACLHADLLESLSQQSVLRQTDAGLLQLMSMTQKLFLSPQDEVGKIKNPINKITTGFQAVEGQWKDKAN